MLLFAVGTVAERPSAGMVVAHAGFYAGVVLLLGIAVLAVWAFDRAPARLRRAAVIAWVVAAASAIVIGESRRSALGLAYGEFIGTPLGRAALWRGIGLGVAYIGLLLALLTRARRSAYGLLGIGAAIASAGHVLSSHAGVGSNAPLKLAQQAVHIVSVGAWIGGLAALLVALGALPADARMRAVRRFSLIAGGALVVVAGTGVLRGLHEVGSIGALVGTTYGKIVLLKAELLLGLAVLGAVNRYRHVPAGEAGLTGLRRAGVGELAIAAIALTVTGVLSGTSPAREAYALEQAAQQPTISTNEQAGVTFTTLAFPDGSEIQVYADPGLAGRNEIHVTAFDPSGKETPIADLRLSVRLGAQTLISEVRRFSTGHFIATATMSAGTWTVDLDLDQGTMRRTASFPLDIA